MSEKKNDIETKGSINEFKEKAGSFLEKWSKAKRDFRNAKKNFGKKKFMFQVIENGEINSYERFAKSEKELISELNSEGIKVLNVVESESHNIFLDAIDGIKQMGSVSLVEIGAFTSSMSLLTRNGEDVLGALKETIGTISNSYFKNKIQILIENLSSGQKEPNQYFAEFPEIFDETYISILKTADKSGKYGEAFREISEQIRIKIRLNKLKSKAKTKPLMNISVFLIVSLGMLLFVFPKMKDLFKNQELPQITQIFLSVSDFLGQNFLIMLLIAVAIFIIAKQAFENAGVRAFFDRLWLKIPVIKDGVKNSNMYIFANTFETLGYSGYDSLSSLEQLRTSITNTVYLEEIQKMINESKSGSSRSETPISDIMNQNKDLWRTKTSNMIVLVSSGEKVAKIHEPLRKEKETFLKEYEESVNKVIGFLNTLVFFLTALMVLGLVLAIMLPLLSFDPSASRNAMSQQDYTQ